LNSVTFEYENEKATKVALVGNFNNWNKDSDVMTKENNTWKITKELEAGTYEYQYVVDDTDWVVDPKTETTKNKYEGLNSVIVVK
jgi:1,4-alpha-glucan branching enzyme